MRELRQALAVATAELSDAVVGARLSMLSDADLARSGGEIESAARLIDAARVLHAAEVARRAESREGLAAALGYRDGVDMVAGVARISGGAAKQRIRTGEAIAPRVSATGAAIPPRFEVISAAVLTGRLGIEAAGLLITQLDSASPTLPGSHLRAAEESLVDLVAGTADRPPLGVDLVRGEAAALVARIDPDSIRPREQRARAKRFLRFGREDADGLTSVHGALLPIVAAQFQRLCEAHIRSAKPTFRAAESEDDQSSAGASSAGSAEAPAPQAENQAARADSRTRDQKRHDVLGAILDAAARVADAPNLAGGPPAVLVTVTQDVLDAGRGAAYVDGMRTPVSLDVVEQFIDSAGSQPVALSSEGAILALGSVQRCFTPSQRRAINARDGGCLIPGCPIPAGLCEVHHVVPYRSGGITHVSNGVLLCWWHHHIIDSGPWRLQMQRGVPHVRGPGHPDWTVATKRRTTLPGLHPPRHPPPEPPPSGPPPAPAS